MLLWVSEAFLKEEVQSLPGEVAPDHAHSMGVSQQTQGSSWADSQPAGREGREERAPSLGIAYLAGESSSLHSTIPAKVNLSALQCL